MRRLERHQSAYCRFMSVQTISKKGRENHEGNHMAHNAYMHYYSDGTGGMADYAVQTRSYRHVLRLCGCRWKLLHLLLCILYCIGSCMGYPICNCLCNCGICFRNFPEKKSLSASRLNKCKAQRMAYFMFVMYFFTLHCQIGAVSQEF